MADLSLGYGGTVVFVFLEPVLYLEAALPDYMHPRRQAPGPCGRAPYTL